MSIRSTARGRTQVGHESEHPTARLSTTARIVAASVLVLGPACQAATWLIMSSAGGSVEEYFAWVPRNPGAADLAQAAAVLAMPFLVGGVVVLVLLGRRRSPRLAWIGGSLLAAGFVALATRTGWEALLTKLSRDEVMEPAELSGLINDLGSPAAGIVDLVFLLGIAVGLPLTVASLWRSRAVPRPAVALWLAFLVVDLAGRGVEAHVIAVVAMAWIALAVLRADAQPFRAMKRE